MRRTAALLAIGFGCVLALAEVARNWGNWQWWPFWLVDFVAAALLVAGGRLELGGSAHAGRTLAGAWGFASAMFYMSFWSHVEHFDEAADGNLAQAPLTFAIGLLWAVTVVGFGLSLAPERRSDRQDEPDSASRGISSS